MFGMQDSRCYGQWFLFFVNMHMGTAVRKESRENWRGELRANMIKTHCINA